MDDADAALARDANGQARFGDGVHGGGGERDVEGEVAREFRGGVHFGWQDGGLAREEEDVVERETFGDGTFNHENLGRKSKVEIAKSKLGEPESGPKTTQPSGWPPG